MENDKNMKNVLHDTKNAIYMTGMLDTYSKYYLRYKFLSCKLKHKFNILSPNTVHWTSTYNCNFYCKHCEANAGDMHVPELSTKEICDVITELGNMNIKMFSITGGEPLVRKDIFQVIRHVLDTGMRYGIASNGYLVTKFEDEFREMVPYDYFTSIDGLEKTNDEIRGRDGAFRKSIEALEFFKSLGVKHRLVNTVVIPDNIEQLSELKKIIMDSAATFWRLSVPIPVGRAKNNEKTFLNDEQLKYLFDFVMDASKELDVELSDEVGYLGCLSLKLRSRPFFCGAGLTKCYIMPDGEVFGCSIFYDNKFSEGNIRNKPFKEIWQTGFSRFRDQRCHDEKCLSCEHLSSCQGGCWGMRPGNKHCYKDIWSDMC
jgi:radical SAM protein with 4Fe4S-binding SPASM domain